MFKTLTLRMAASTLLVFSVGVALAAGPADTRRALSTGTAAGGEQAAHQTAAAAGGRVRLPRPRKVPSQAPSEAGQRTSADPDGESTRRGASRDTHDRYANAETDYLLGSGVSVTQLSAPAPGET